MDNLPTNNIFEVSLIGTGGGYGESVVIHMGDDNWAVIDSCIDPNSKNCLPLQYLEAKGVNVATNVKLIVCTHWHNDHVQGISTLLAACKSAVFSMARANDRKKFLLLVGLDTTRLKVSDGSSSTSEIQSCFEILSSRQTTFKNAEQDKTLFSSVSGKVSASIKSLSPSDLVVSEFDSEISTLISEFGKSNRKIINNKPNNKSVVLLISVNEHSAIFGADLEVTANPKKGWLCILDNSTVIKGVKAGLVKIPHHGSSNGYHDRIWTEIVEKDPTAKLTPWNIGKKLPKQEMLDTYLRHTANLFITSDVKKSSKPKKREKRIEKTIFRFNPTLREIRYDFGIVRSRLDLNISGCKWKTELFGSAKQIENERE